MQVTRSDESGPLGGELHVGRSLLGLSTECMTNCSPCWAVPDQDSYMGTCSGPNCLPGQTLRGAGSHIYRVHIFQDVYCYTPCNTRSRLAGCAFAGQVSNLLARGARFQLIASSLPRLALAQYNPHSNRARRQPCRHARTTLWPDTNTRLDTNLGVSSHRNPTSNRLAANCSGIGGVVALIATRLKP